MSIRRLIPAHGGQFTPAECGQFIRRMHWDSRKHYIKLENHYKQPEAYFRGNVQLSELLSSSFQQDLKKGLLTSYQSIMKTGTTAIPKSKADINAGTIPLMILKELERMYDFNTEELIKGKLKGKHSANYVLTET